MTNKHLKLSTNFVSILSIFTKILERIVSKQLINYICTKNLIHPFQSAYLPGKSTETALTKVTSDILTELDSTNGNILTLLEIHVHAPTTMSYIRHSTASQMHWRYIPTLSPHHHRLRHHINSQMALGKLASLQLPQNRNNTFPFTTPQHTGTRIPIMTTRYDL